MKKYSKFGYLPYIGPEGFVFMRSYVSDMAYADSLADELAGNGVRVFSDCAGAKNCALPEEVAAGIQNCETAVFVLSDTACANLDFRNSINYALKEKKKVVRIRDEGFVPGYGLDMQLANVPAVSKKGAASAAAVLAEGGFLPDKVKGPGLVAKQAGTNRRTQSYIALAVAAVLLITGAVIVKNRVDYLNSAEYQLRNVDNAEYLDISRFDDSALELLDGKTIGTLYMEGMDAKDISAISRINVTDVDIAHNPDVASLDPLLECRGIKSVTVSQDMLDKAPDLPDAGIEVKVVR